MATNANPFNPDKLSTKGNDSDGSQDNFMSTPVSVSGSEAQDDSGGAPNASGASPKPTSSGRFQNLNAYLKANQGFNKEGGGLAGKVNQNLTSKSNDLQKNFAQSQQDYQTSLNNARQRYDSSFVDNSLKNPTGASQNSQASGTNQAAPPAPTGMSDDDISKFQGMLNAQYKGPTGLDPNLNAQASNFSNLAGNTGSEQGRFNLLQNLYNKPTYSSGQRTLDNLMLQSNPQQIAALQGNKTIANNLNNNLRSAQVQAGVQASDATNEANNTRNATREALTGAVTGFNTGMEGNVKTALGNREAAFQKELFGLQNPNQGISSVDAQKFGLLGKLGDANSQSIYNLDPGAYLQQSNVNPTGQTVASADDYNRIAALQKLSGSYGNEDMSKVFDTYNNPALAGSFAKEDPYSFGVNAQTGHSFAQDLANVKGQYEGEKDPQQNNYNQAYLALHGDPTVQGKSPDIPWEGGYLGEIGREGATERDKMQKAYTLAQTNAKNSGTSVEDLYRNTPGGIPFDPTGKSDNDVLKAAGSSYTKNHQTDPYASLLSGYDSNNQKLNNSQQALNQLLQKYGVNRTVGINDASSFQPTQVNVDPSRQMDALNKIYNR